MLKSKSLAANKPGPKGLFATIKPIMAAVIRAIAADLSLFMDSYLFTFWKQI